MTTPREKWTDERLDDLNKKVDDGSVRGDTGLRELRGEMNERFDKLDAKFDSKFDRLTLVLLASTIGTIGTVLAAAAAIIATNS
jgi:hypothetical protein